MTRLREVLESGADFDHLQRAALWVVEAALTEFLCNVGSPEMLFGQVRALGMSEKTAGLFEAKCKDPKAPLGIVSFKAVQFLENVRPPEGGDNYLKLLTRSLVNDYQFDPDIKSNA